MLPFSLALFPSLYPLVTLAYLAYLLVTLTSLLLLLHSYSYLAAVASYARRYWPSTSKPATFAPPIRAFLTPPNFNFNFYCSERS